MVEAVIFKPGDRVTLNDKLFEWEKSVRRGPHYGQLELFREARFRIRPGTPLVVIQHKGRLVNVLVEGRRTRHKYHETFLEPLSALTDIPESRR